MIPRVIYFDTNAIHEAGLTFSNDWMSRLRAEIRDLPVELAVPELVASETSHAFGRKCVEAADKIRNHAEFIEAVAGVPTGNVIDSTVDLMDRVSKQTRSRLSENGISVFPNSAPDVKELVARAVAKVPPFQPGDKGFRDCVIIESILANARTVHDGHTVMIVSSDRTFIKGVRQLTKEGEIDMILCAPEDAAKSFKQCFSDAVKIFRAEEEAKAKNFLDDHLKEIHDYVRSQRLADAILRLGTEELQNKTIKSLEAVRPKSIEWVRPQVGDEKPGARIPIQFGVRVELDLSVSGGGYGSLFELEYRLDQPGPPTKRGAITPDSTESELTIDHTVHVFATVRLTGDEEAPYADLQLGDDSAWRRFLQASQAEK